MRISLQGVREFDIVSGGDPVTENNQIDRKRGIIMSEEVFVFFFLYLCKIKFAFNRPFPHCNEQWRRVEVRLDKNTRNE